MNKSSEIIKKCLAEIPHEFSMMDKRFVITGNSSVLEREQFIDLITHHGGKVFGSVSGKTDYLIVCSLVSEDWKYGNFGNKLDKAIQLKEQGAEILIIDEKIAHEFFAQNQKPLNNFFSLKKQLDDAFENHIFNDEDAEMFKFILKRAEERSIKK